MKKIVSVTEVEGEGLTALLGERVALFCMNYIYAGTLAGVNDSCVLLEDAKIVYETGELAAGGWEDAQSLPGKWRVMIQGIESWGPAKC